MSDKARRQLCLSVVYGRLLEGDLEATAGAVPAVPPFAFTLLNAVGDLFQIIPAVEKGALPPNANLDVGCCPMPLGGATYLAKKRGIREEEEGYARV